MDQYMDIPENERQSAALVGLNTGADGLHFEKSMKELAALASAAGFRVSGVFTQNLQKPGAGYYIGSGKIEEIRAYLGMTGIDLVIFDSQLSPTQLKNLSAALGAEVLDRTALILQIFGGRARTREAALQVEYASLQYMLPRLTGLHRELGRQAGTSGSMSSRGAGEKKLELDRRRIESRMAEVRRDLESVGREREIQRKRRAGSGLPMAALVGYTNAGKSTIMNGMLREFGEEGERSVFEEDMLFATLDTTIRRISPGGGKKPFLLSDTVGFIDNLPVPLIRAFRSTLEEASLADLLVIVTDLTDPDYRENLEVTVKTLSEIGAGGIPRLFVFNKADLADRGKDIGISVPCVSAEDAKITISAKDPADIARLADEIGRCVNRGRIFMRLMIPYSDGAALASLRKTSDITVLEYTEIGTLVEGALTESDAGRYRAYSAGT